MSLESADSDTINENEVSTEVVELIASSYNIPIETKGDVSQNV